MGGRRSEEEDGEMYEVLRVRITMSLKVGPFTMTAINMGGAKKKNYCTAPTGGPPPPTWPSSFF